MIRRTPTLIALEEDEIESHLQRIFLRHTLTVNFEQLHLDDSVRSSSLSSGSDAGFDTSGSTRSYAEPNPPGTSSTIVPMKSCLRPSSSNRTRSVQKAISALYPADEADPPRLRVTDASSPQELELHSGRAIRSSEHETVHPGEDHPTSHKDTTYKSMPIDSSNSPDVSFLSCGISSSPATVPLRDLTLAPTMCYEATLADEASFSATGSVADGSERRSPMIA